MINSDRLHRTLDDCLVVRPSGESPLATIQVTLKEIGGPRSVEFKMDIPDFEGMELESEAGVKGEEIVYKADSRLPRSGRVPA